MLITEVVLILGLYYYNNKNALNTNVFVFKSSLGIFLFKINNISGSFMTNKSFLFKMS